MKNMKKLVALFAATVMTMSIGVSAFAAGVSADPENDIANEVFNLVFTIGESEAEQLTMIAYLVDAETDPANIPDYSSQEVVAIDQVGGTEGFGTVPVDTAKLEEGYAIAVAIGGTGVTEPDKHLITYADEETVVVTYYLGDVNGDTKITLADYQQVLLKVKRKTPDFPVGEAFTTAGKNTYYLGDVNGDTKITLADYQQILLKVKRKTPEYPVGDVLQ